MKEAEKNPLAGEYRAIDAEYRREIAFVHARPILRKVLFGTWLALDAGLVLFFLLVVVPYIVSGSFADARQMAFLANNVESTRAHTVAQSPERLIVRDPKVISGSDGKYDLAVQVENTNEKWYATLEYIFRFDGGESQRETGFILPGQATTLLGLQTPSVSTPRNVQVEFVDFAWHKVDPHAVPRVSEWLEERNNFPVANPLYVNDVNAASETFTRTSFSLTNRSAYSYWEPKFMVFLERANNTVAITTVTLSQFIAGETRQVEMHLFDSLPASATVRVEPVINFFDKEVYMKPQE